MARIVEIDKVSSADGRPLITAVTYESGYTRYYVNRVDRIPEKVSAFIRSAHYAVRGAGMNDNVTVYTGGETA